MEDELLMVTCPRCKTVIYYDPRGNKESKNLCPKCKTVLPELEGKLIIAFDWRSSSGQSRAAARAWAHAKEKAKNIVKILSFDWEPDHPPELRNSFEDSEGQLWEVWTVAEGFQGQVPEL